jgi:hypothetical protein
MLVRAVLSALLLCLFALPARADIAYPSACKGKQEGDSCRDIYSGGVPGQCRHKKCFIGSYDGQEPIEDYQYDCFRCTSPQQAALEQREEALRAQAQQAARAERIRWGLGALGAGCVITAVWYNWRRRSKVTSAGSAST